MDALQRLKDQSQPGTIASLECCTGEHDTCPFELGRYILTYREGQEGIGRYLIVCCACKCHEVRLQGETRYVRRTLLLRAGVRP